MVMVMVRMKDKMEEKVQKSSKWHPSSGSAPCDG